MTPSAKIVELSKLATSRAQLVLILFGQEVDSRRKADHDDDRAHMLRLGLLGEVSAKVPADHPRYYHQDRLRPLHCVRHNEQQHSHAVRDGRQQRP